MRFYVNPDEILDGSSKTEINKRKKEKSRKGKMNFDFATPIRLKIMFKSFRLCLNLSRILYLVSLPLEVE